MIKVRTRLRAIEETAYEEDTIASIGEKLLIV